MYSSTTDLGKNIWVSEGIGDKGKGGSHCLRFSKNTDPSIWVQWSGKIGSKGCPGEGCRGTIIVWGCSEGWVGESKMVYCISSPSQLGLSVDLVSPLA
jgi:hypothetical protein